MCNGKFAINCVNMKITDMELLREVDARAKLIDPVFHKIG